MEIELLNESIETLKSDIKLNRTCAWIHAIFTGISGFKLISYGKDWTFALVINAGMLALCIGVMAHKRKKLANC